MYAACVAFVSLTAQVSSSGGVVKLVVVCQVRSTLELGCGYISVGFGKPCVREMCGEDASVRGWGRR